MMTIRDKIIKGKSYIKLLENVFRKLGIKVIPFKKGMSKIQVYNEFYPMNLNINFMGQEYNDGLDEERMIDYILERVKFPFKEVSIKRMGYITFEQVKNNAELFFFKFEIYVKNNYEDENQ